MPQAPATGVAPGAAQPPPSPTVPPPLEAIPPPLEAMEPPPSHGTRAGGLGFWLSPAGQPPWVRPALLAVAALCGLSCAWGLGNLSLETFYAADRSMGSKWEDFFFGAVDPNGTVSLDKLPGAMWVQALSVRLFGFHH